MVEKTYMTEKAYIDSTNLAKLRTAKTIVRDVLYVDEVEEGEDQRLVIKTLGEMERKLTEAISIRADTE